MTIDSRISKVHIVLLVSFLIYDTKNTATGCTIVNFIQGTIYGKLDRSPSLEQLDEPDSWMVYC